jgi:hypothetical protein
MLIREWTPPRGSEGVLNYSGTGQIDQPKSVDFHYQCVQKSFF